MGIFGVNKNKSSRSVKAGGHTERAGAFYKPRDYGGFLATFVSDSVLCFGNRSINKTR